MKRAALLLVTASIACSKGGSPGSNPDGAPISAGDAGDAGARLPEGRLAGTISMTIDLQIDTSIRSDILAHKMEIESEGAKVEADGSVVHIATPVGGWKIALGNQVTFTDADGKFTVTRTASDPQEAMVYRAKDLDNPFAQVSVSGLANEGQTPDPIAFVVTATTGVCAMNGGTGAAPSGCHAGSGLSPGPGELPMQNPIKMGPLGTYPAGNQDQCANDDGIVWANTGGFRGVVSYLAFSTCMKRVSQACCVDEFGAPLGIAKSIIHIFVDSVHPNCCYKSHNGRFCQELTPGDFAAKTASGVVQGSAFHVVQNSPDLKVTVPLGVPSPVTVHNNNCSGVTAVLTVQNDAQGKLEAVHGADFNGARLLHYDAAKAMRFSCESSRVDPTIYAADQDLQYRAPACVGSMPGSAPDRFVFESESKGVQVEFDISKAHLFQRDNGMIFSGEAAATVGFIIAPPDASCDKCHVLRVDPCTGNAAPSTGCGAGKVTPLDSADFAMCASMDGGMPMDAGPMCKGIYMDCTNPSECCNNEDCNPLPFGRCCKRLQESCNGSRANECCDYVIPPYSVGTQCSSNTATVAGKCCSMAYTGPCTTSADCCNGLPCSLGEGVAGSTVSALRCCIQPGGTGCHDVNECCSHGGQHHCDITTGRCCLFSLGPCTSGTECCSNVCMPNGQCQ